MKNGCPMVKGGEALQLIEDLENFNLNRRRICKLSQVEETVMARWKARWTEVPEAVWEVLGSGLEMMDPVGPFKQDFHKVLPWNRRMRKVEAAKNVVLHLFSGKDQSFWQDNSGGGPMFGPAAGPGYPQHGGEGLFVPAVQPLG